MPKKEKVKVAPTPLPILGSFAIEVREGRGGKRGVLVSACEEILAYSHEEISFRHKKVIICVKGTNLWCRTYGSRVAEVVGQVDTISFEGVK